MLIKIKRKLKFVRFCWLLKFWIDTEFSGSLYARSCSMVYNVTVLDRLMPLVVKAMHTANTHNVLTDSYLGDVQMCLNGSGS